MSNSRIQKTFGKDGNFGQTLADRQSTPNLLQTTIAPANVDNIPTTIQQHNFIFNITAFSLDGGTTAILSSASTLNIPIDLVLTASRYYQITAFITITLRPIVIDNETYVCGNYSIVGSSKGISLVGTCVGVLTNSDPTFSTYISTVDLTIDGENKFNIDVTTNATDIAYSYDILINTTITSSSYSAVITPYIL